MKNKSNSIYLFTTEGCEGCRIAENIFNKAIDKSNISLNFEVVCCNTDYLFQVSKLYQIDDFPTAVFVKHGLTIAKIVGTTTVSEILKTINECFKSY